MKWNVEKMSPIIDATIVVLAILTLMLIFGKDWFFSDESTMPLFIAVMTMTAYRIGMWSGRRCEKNKRGNQ